MNFWAAHLVRAASSTLCADCETPKRRRLSRGRHSERPIHDEHVAQAAPDPTCVALSAPRTRPGAQPRKATGLEDQHREQRTKHCVSVAWCTSTPTFPLNSEFCSMDGSTTCCTLPVPPLCFQRFLIVRGHLGRQFSFTFLGRATTKNPFC